MERKINPNTGCYCNFAQRMTGDGCDICNPEYAEELRKEAELEGAKNTEQQVQPDNGVGCTRPEITNAECHAKNGRLCMNGIICPPLQVK